MFETGHDAWNAGWQVLSELMDVANDGWETDGEQETEREEDCSEQKGDGRRAGDAPAVPDFEHDDAIDDGREDNGKERADVDQDKDIAQSPGECERKNDTEGKEDVASGGVGLRILGGG